MSEFSLGDLVKLGKAHRGFGHKRPATNSTKN